MKPFDTFYQTARQLLANTGLPTKNSARTIVGRNKYRGDEIRTLSRVAPF